MEYKEWVKECWEKLDKKLSRTAVSSFNKIPYTTKDGVHDDKMQSDPSWWTNGFWPATMMIMHIGTGKQQYLDTARNSMKLLDKALFNFNGLHHDVGFMWNISSGVDYRFTGDEEERNRMMIAANHLMGRYNCDGGYIRAWNGENVKGFAIIDCMMNIPLLYRAAVEDKDDRFATVANRHARKTIDFHIRPDGSCNHINDYDPLTGELLRTYGGQGYCEGSSWSRGQAWGLYGFALAYRHTKNEEYLNVAKRIAHYFISCVQANDWLTLCDFRQPAEPVIYDSTAAMCAVCGLLEIADSVPEAERGLYFNSALTLLKVSEEKFCDWSETEDSIVQYGTERYDSGIHMPIIYGDYFFAEAIYRLMGFDSSILW